MSARQGHTDAGNALNWRTFTALFLVALTLAAAVAAGVLWAALNEAERGLVTALEGKAKAHARIVRGDVELALRLGIPLDVLPGAFEYLEGGAQTDPDIRFVAITDTGPAAPALWRHRPRQARPTVDERADAGAAERAASHPDQPLRPCRSTASRSRWRRCSMPRRHAGFIVVAVQGRQVQEALIERLTQLLPAALAFIVLLRRAGRRGPPPAPWASPGGACAG